MTGQEYLEWMIFDRVEPIGPTRGDFQAALIAHTIAKTGGGRGAKRLKISDFLPQWWRERKAQPLGGMLGMAAAITRRFGGEVAPTAEQAIQNATQEVRASERAGEADGDPGA